MPVITYDDVQRVITRNGKLFIPEVIERAVKDCVPDDVVRAEEASQEVRQKFKELNQPVSLDYDRPEITRAYVLHYLRRNTLIPRIAIRDVVLNRALQDFPPKMRVLDLGSGTGAVTLGLLEMFSHPPFNSIALSVDAVDRSETSLALLKELQRACGLANVPVRTFTRDLTDLAELDALLRMKGPYNLVFAANVFNELGHEQSCAILNVLSKHLGPRAVMVIANAQRNFTKTLQPLLVAQASRDGLAVYYPCSCQCQRDCFFWREHDYEHKKLQTNTGIPLRDNFREQLVALWLILCNKPLTVFDDFKRQHPKLDWGVFSIRGTDPRKFACEVCTPQGLRVLPPQTTAYRRGALVGCAGDPLQIVEYFEL